MCSRISERAHRAALGLQNKLKDLRGQATVEAAFALPILMVLILLMLQPAIFLYDKMAMRAAAAEGCRLLATSSGDAGTNEDYIRRRLSVIPDIDIFHMHDGGCTYEIDMIGDEESQEVKVTISNELKPLPLIDILMGATNTLTEGGGIVVKAESSLHAQPNWAMSSPEGSAPKEWVSNL